MYHWNLVAKRPGLGKIKLLKLKPKEIASRRLGKKNIGSHHFYTMLIQPLYFQNDSIYYATNVLPKCWALKANVLQAESQGLQQFVFRVTPTCKLPPKSQERTCFLHQCCSFQQLAKFGTGAAFSFLISWTLSCLDLASATNRIPLIWWAQCRSFLED